MREVFPLRDTWRSGFLASPNTVRTVVRGTELAGTLTAARSPIGVRSA
jgi:hypothetical protein